MDASVTFPDDWQPPAELTRPVPREVRRTGSGIMLTVLAIVMAAAAVPAALAMRLSDARVSAQTALLRAEGQDVMAEVKALRKVGKDQEPRMTYAFALGDGLYQSNVKMPRSA